jgi:hypothetical protein
VRAINAPIAPDDLPRETRPESTATVAVSQPVSVEDATRAATQRHVVRGTETAEKLWQRLMAGEDFWTVVHQPFKAHELTRDDLAALIDKGLTHTRGSYRALLTTFGLPTSDYKRFHAFLYQQNCNLPVGPYRSAKAAVRSGGGPRPDSAFSPAC